MIDLDSIELPLDGWREASRTDDAVTWHNERGESLMLNVFHVTPDIPSMTDLEALRDRYRAALGDQGGLVFVDVLEIAKLPAVRTLFKLGIPGQERGRVYLAGITLPFREASLVVRVQCVETGMTGIRETIVLNKLMGAGEKFAPDDEGVMQGWASDPYRPETPFSSLLRNRADDERWDELFPDHPLSRARGHLRELAAELELDPRVYDEPPFSEPARSPLDRGRRGTRPLG